VADSCSVLRNLQHAVAPTASAASSSSSSRHTPALQQQQQRLVLLIHQLQGLLLDLWSAMKCLGASCLQDEPAVAAAAAAAATAGHSLLLGLAAVNDAQQQREDAEGEDAAAAAAGGVSEDVQQQMAGESRYLTTTSFLGLRGVSCSICHISLLRYSKSRHGSVWAEFVAGCNPTGSKARWCLSTEPWLISCRHRTTWDIYGYQLIEASRHHRPISSVCNILLSYSFLLFGAAVRLDGLPSRTCVGLTPSVSCYSVSKLAEHRALRLWLGRALVLRTARSVPEA